MKEGETQDKILKLPACVDSPAQIWTFFLFFSAVTQLSVIFLGLWMVLHRIYKQEILITTVAARTDFLIVCSDGLIRWMNSLDKTVFFPCIINKMLTIHFDGDEQELTL